MNDLSWNGVAERAADLWARQLEIDASSASSSGFRFQANSTSAFNNELEFAAQKSVRTSVVILASFNAIAAFATAAGIFWDCYTTTKRGEPTFNLRTSFWKVIGPAETFPFILCCGIVAQGIMFAVAQSKGLGALLILGCTPISQMMLPATLIVPYIQIVFGVETTVRASWRRPFPRQPKWITPACVGIVAAASLATLLITRLHRAPNFCAASLFWFLEQWKVGCLGVFTAVVGTSFIAAVVVFLRLHSGARVDPAERVAASWMAYFMAISVVTNTLLVPFFYSISFADTNPKTDGQIQLSMVASVVANLSGLLTGGLYLFLRSSQYATIKPKGYFDSDRQQLKKGIRIWAPSNYTYTNQMAQPVSPPAQYQRAASRQDEAKQEEENTQSPTGTPTYAPPNPLALNSVQAELIPKKLDLARVAEAKRSRAYTRDDPDMESSKEDAHDSKNFGLLPAATYTPGSGDELMMPSMLLPPPPPIYGQGHRRDSSMASSATVQIGLRLSNVNDMEPLTSSYSQESSQDPNQVHDLGCPNYNRPRGSRKVSPLATNTTTVRETGAGLEKDMDSRESRGKNSGEKNQPDDEIRLSPTVYSPQNQTSQPRVTTPIGIGFSTPDARPVRTDANQVRKADWI